LNHTIQETLETRASIYSADIKILILQIRKS